MRVTHGALLGVVGVLVVGALVAVAALWPGQLREEEAGVDIQGSTRLVDAVLVDVEEVAEVEEDVGLMPDAVLVDITARLEATGELVELTMSDDTGDTFAAGQRVRLQEVVGTDGSTTYLVSDFRRERPMLALAALFLFAVVAFGRWQGARALLGLALTFALILAFVVPAILTGRDPVAVALVGAVLIMVVTLYLSHGWSRKTTAAVVGTAAALALTGLLAVLFVAAAQLTGFTSEEARLANVEVGGLSLTGLLLAGIIIGGLGVLDDVTMSQASTVFELHRANPAARFGDLLRGALNVGRDHIAATVNTLFLAYAGASLPLLILFVTADLPLGTVVTSEIVAVEVVRTLVGSVGLIAAVPLTTALAAALVQGEPEAAAAEAARPGGHSHAAPVPARPDAPSADPRRAGEEDDEDDWIDRLRGAYGLRREDGRADGG